MKAKSKSLGSRASKVTTTRSTTYHSLVKQHEQAILVVLAYLIGFTTAFIAFKLADDSQWTMDVALDEFGYENEESDYASVSIKEGALLAHKGEADVTLSVQADLEVEEDGFHHNVLAASVSPNGRFVHYCVQLTSDSDTCTNFIYSFDRDVIYRVKNGEGQMSSSAEEVVETMWTDDGRLSLTRYQSVSPETPWQMAAR